MTKSEAMSLRDKILRLCDAEKQWVVVSEERKPNTKMIKLEVSIKIDK
jgi:hypothetical protein